MTPLGEGIEVQPIMQPIVHDGEEKGRERIALSQAALDVEAARVAVDGAHA